MIPIWPKVPLKTIYKGLYDGPHATPAESDEGAIFLGIKNVTESGRLDLSEIRYIAEADLGKWTKRVIPQKDDIVFSYEATLHRYARIPEGFRGCLGRRMALIRVNPEIANVDFVFCYFLGPVWRCEVEKNILSGATVDRIPLTNVPDFEIFLPPLVVQQKIASILSAYDDLIENNLKRIKLLEEMAQITYGEWFMRMRFPGHETAPIDSETGLPEGWCFGKVLDLFELQRGFDLPTQERENGAIPIIASTGVTGFHSSYKVNGPGVVTGRSGTIGQVMFIDSDFWPLNTTLWVKNYQSCGPIFAKHFLQNFNLESLCGGSAVPSLDRKAVHVQRIVIPAAKLMKKFEIYASSLYEATKVLRFQNELLKEARDFLLPRLMTGMIDLDSIRFPSSLPIPDAHLFAKY